jgi:pyruvate,water dikinase
VGYDPGRQSLAEQPVLVAELLRDLLDQPAAPELERERQAFISATRARFADDAARARFDEALIFAEFVYPIREDNIHYTDSLPNGLIRRAALAIGERLVQQGRLARATEAAYLEVAELLGAHLNSNDLRALVLKRRAEMAWVRAHPGPNLYGPPASPPPSLRGLPAPARRLNGAILWAMEAEMRPPPEPAADGSVSGIGASAGRYRGRVRVILDAAELHLLERGEVLVCPITTPSWSVYFSRVGALVTDGGSVLSHAAIIAREHGVPAVVATGSATRTLDTGMRVEVDGSAGEVQVLAGA